MGSAAMLDRLGFSSGRFFETEERRNRGNGGIGEFLWVQGIYVLLEL